MEKPKPKPKPTPKPVKTPEPEPQVVQAPPTPAPPTPTPPAPQPSPAPSKTSSNLPPSGAETVGEFNFATSAGDERFSKIQRAIQKHHKYPKRAQKMRHQGVVEVSFVFKKDGSVRDVKVIKSSGFETLDEAAVELINRAAPDFPTLDRDYVIKIPVKYNIT
nr:energy transducer TonB [uncultured Campylobacter sp.]